MLNIYLTRLKILFNQKIMLWWALLFPIVLAVLFKAALSNAYSTDPLETIPISIVNESGNSYGYESFKQTMGEIEISDDKKMFDISYESKTDAVSDLSKGKIDSYIIYGDNLEMVVSESGINQSVIKSILDTYSRVNKIISNVVIENGGSIEGINVDTLYKNGSYVVYSDKLTSQPNPLLNHFYSLIAMACLFSSMFGLKEITSIQANLSTIAARINMTGVPKYKFIIASLAASYTIQVTISLILIAFLKFILKIDFGNRILLVVATCFLSCLFGLFLGSFIGAASKKDVDAKSSIITAITLTGCFFAGLMVANMKFIVATYLPFLVYINPASLIEDALYSLYYYEDLNRYLLNMTMLAIFSLIFGILTILLTRRSKYASI